MTARDPNPTPREALARRLEDASRALQDLGFDGDAATCWEAAALLASEGAAPVPGLREQVATVLIDFGHLESEWQFHGDKENHPRPDPEGFARRILALLTAPDAALPVRATGERHLSDGERALERYIGEVHHSLYPDSGTSLPEFRLAAMSDEIRRSRVKLARLEDEAAALRAAVPEPTELVTTCRCGHDMEAQWVCEHCGHRWPAVPEPLEYATRLATALWSLHFMDAAPKWEPATDLMGVLSQIDNMTSQLDRAAVPEQREPTAREVAEACARICESRASSLMRQKWPDGKAYRISEGNEAGKCAAAIRANWHSEALRGGTPPATPEVTNE